ncbi:hypothetical protein HU200_061992 [Digitaria exilis]|uniref:Expansin-like CBD domain-containing protein n=1 Tax=Digitaria exilis TaxID=1010633 RepID=A0A835DYT8_9POAL|nr:hypothetical protein HU200_061992 [Digitaria exilis]
MASVIGSSKVVALGALIFSLLFSSGSFAVLANFNASHITADPYWVPARATWYGAPTGAGPMDNETVIITDMNYYPVAKYHFDLSGTAFGAMALPGRNDELRHAGIIDIQFKRVPCYYPGQMVTFHIDKGSNPVYFAVLVEFEDGDGDVVQVDLMEANSWVWTPMRESWGSIWRLDSKHRLTAPFSLRITNESGKTLVATQVIPANWAPNTYYRSNIQYYDYYQEQEGPGVGLVISSAAGLDTKILGIIGLISLVLLYSLHEIEVPLATW